MAPFSRRALAGLLLLLALAAPPGAGATTPREPVEELTALLLDVMRNAEALGFGGRYDRLAPVLTRVFNFPVMARIAVGGHWGGLSPEQREQLVDAFTRMSVATYADRFDGYSGESFEILGEGPGPRDTVLVQTTIVRPGEEDVPINYMMREDDGAWRIVDVFLEGRYSELAMRRSEYGSVIERQGFDRLVRALEEQVARMEAGA
ncbi:MAG TPA: ABC transporter substrate-binding protein [Geminicoccaceae bacterium]|nr:ABC transporter substrate-binding protein [Geminicoccaceae bacterium]